MADAHKVVFYPVGNGDSSQIILSGGRRILMDFCHRASSEDDSDPRIDLQKRLNEELDEADRDNFDVVAFTHADDDHIAGSTDFFLRKSGTDHAFRKIGTDQGQTRKSENRGQTTLSEKIARMTETRRQQGGCHAKKSAHRRRRYSVAYHSTR